MGLFHLKLFYYYFNLKLDFIFLIEKQINLFK